VFSSFLSFKYAPTLIPIVNTVIMAKIKSIVISNEMPPTSHDMFCYYIYFYSLAPSNFFGKKAISLSLNTQKKRRFLDSFGENNEQQKTKIKRNV